MMLHPFLSSQSGDMLNSLRDVLQAQRSSSTGSGAKDGSRPASVNQVIFAVGGAGLEGLDEANKRRASGVRCRSQ